jgi:hypothetical protein
MSLDELPHKKWRKKFVVPMQFHPSHTWSNGQFGPEGLTVTCGHFRTACFEPVETVRGPKRASHAQIVTSRDVETTWINLVWMPITPTMPSTRLGPG